MAVVVDASLLVPLASGDPRKPLVQERLRQWLVVDEDLHAPSLIFYEVASGLTRIAAAGQLDVAGIADAWASIARLPITLHEIREDGPALVSIALRLGRRSAYDAAYLALAQRLNAELWTFDGPLARNAGGLGFPVRLLG